MIYVDSRVGSEQYAKMLGKAELTHLDFGDCCFSGNGANGPVTVGIEIKKISDALSCMIDGRFAGHQLPGLVQSYDRVWLIVEGLWRSEPLTGILQVAKGGWSKDKLGGIWKDSFTGYSRVMYKQFVGWLTSLEMGSGIRVRCTMTEPDTAETIKELYQWWGKEWGEHHSLHTFHEDRPEAALLSKPNLVRRVAAEINGIGWQRSAAVARKFRTVAAMVSANEKDWESIEGIGKTLARGAVEALNHA